MSFNYTTVKKLYKGKFQYNIVLTLAYGDIFQGSDKSKYQDRHGVHTRSIYFSRLNGFTAGHSNAASTLLELVLKMEDFATRFSDPNLTIYTNNYDDIIKIRTLIPTYVKSIGIPPEGLEPGMVYMPDTPYEYRVTVHEIFSLNEAFVEWVDNTDKVKLQGRTRTLLSETKHYHVNTGAQLYVNGEHNLLLVKMHLGDVKISVDRILN